MTHTSKEDEGVRVCILDSGGSGLENILTWLSEKPSVKEVRLIKSSEQFLEKIEREQPDLVFIRLGNIDIPGLGIGMLIKTMYRDIRIIFVSEEKEYALEAYEIGAYGYLLSPIEKKKFDNVFNK